MPTQSIDLCMVRHKADGTEIYALSANHERLHLKGIRIIEIQPLTVQRGIVTYQRLIYDDVDGTAEVMNYGPFKRTTRWERLKGEWFGTYLLLCRLLEAIFR